MNDSKKTRRTGGTRLSEPVSQALNAILASCRAWYHFQEHAHELCRITDNQLQNALKLDLSEIETATRAWIDTAGSAEAASVFAPSYCFLLRVSAIERVHERRCLDGLYNADLAGIAARMDAIRQREGLKDDEFWPIGQGPDDWEELTEQHSHVLDRKFEEALREYGFDDIADLYRVDRKSYDARREQGRRLAFDDVPELERLSVLQKQFESEAKICAEGGAYHAAAVMIGSAIEAALLFACLNRRDDALHARNRLPARERPNRANPKRWSLHELAVVAGEAGWLPNFKVAEGTLRSRPLLDMMRDLRNLAHPGCHLSNRRIAEVECAYGNARAAYILLKWHLANVRTGDVNFPCHGGCQHPAPFWTQG